VSADITNSLPLSVTSGTTPASIDLSLPNGKGGRGTPLEYHTVGPTFFRTFGVETSVRVADAASGATDVVPVVVTREAANQYWPGRNPVGQSINEFLLEESAGTWVRGNVIGVVPDVQYGSPGAAPAAGIYVSYADDPPLRAALIIKASVAPEKIVIATRGVLRALDPQLVLYDTKTMESRVRDVSAATRFGSLVLAAYAAVAFVIALIGVYSVIAFGVVQRRAELGIRMALGATARGILANVLARGARVTMAGIGIGIVSSFAAGRLLSSHLYGVAAGDPAYAALVIVAFTAAGILASVLPAIAATRVDPASALRAE